MSRPARRTRTSLFALAAAAATSATLVSAPAFAQTKTVTDPARDTNAANDVVKVTFINNGPRITAVATYRNLGRGHLGATLVVDPGARGGRTYHLVRGQGSDGRWHTWVWEGRGNQVGGNIRCPHKRVRADNPADTITFRLPRTCLGRDAGAASAYLQIAGGVQEGGGVRQEHAPNRPLNVRRD